MYLLYYSFSAASQIKALCQDHPNGNSPNISMLLQGLLLATLFSSLTNAINCNADLGTSIRPLDCEFAKAILYTKLGLSHPADVNFMNSQRPFTIDAGGDPRYHMPQGASFGTCGIGIDITPARAASASWTQLFSGIDTLVTACPGSQATPGRGGLLIFGPFNLFVVAPGAGSCMIAGTCMAPNPIRTQPLPLLLELAGRYRGFDRVAASRLLQPATTLLPAPPALFHLGFSLTSPWWPQYRIGGQWVCNTDYWSPMIKSNALLTTHPTPVFILLAAFRATAGPPSSFSRNFPRPMASAWFRIHNANPILVRGAWGARGLLWYPISGDLTNVQLLVRTYEWVLVELGSSSQTGGPTSPGTRQQLASAAANQGQAASFPGPQTSGPMAGQQQAAGPSGGAGDDDNQSEATIPNDQEEANPNDLLADLGYGSNNQDQATGSGPSQAMGSLGAELSSLPLGPSYQVTRSAFNTSTAVASSNPTLLPQYFDVPGPSGVQGEVAGRPIKRPRLNS